MAGTHGREIHRCDEDRALAEVDVERRLRFVVDEAEVQQQVRDGAVAMAGAALGLVHLIIDHQWPAALLMRSRMTSKVSRPYFACISAVIVMAPEFTIGWNGRFVPFWSSMAERVAARLDAHRNAEAVGVGLAQLGDGCRDLTGREAGIPLVQVLDDDLQFVLLHATGRAVALGRIAGSLTAQQRTTRPHLTGLWQDRQNWTTMSGARTGRKRSRHFCRFCGYSQTFVSGRAPGYLSSASRTLPRRVLGVNGLGRNDTRALTACPPSADACGNPDT